MGYHVQRVLDVLHETAALSKELEALVVAYETDDTKGLIYSERKDRMARFTRAHTSLETSLSQAVSSSRELVALLTQAEVDELFNRLESDVANARLFLNDDQEKVSS